jgi:hypothetical protein
MRDMRIARAPLSRYYRIVNRARRLPRPISLLFAVSDD